MRASTSGPALKLARQRRGGREGLTEVPQESLNRPRRRVSESADRMPLNLLGQLVEHIDLPLVRAALDEPVHHLLEPGRALAARRALSARLVLVELCALVSGCAVWEREERERTLAKRAMARTMSVDLSMTMTAPVPRPDCRSLSESKSILRAFTAVSFPSHLPTMNDSQSLLGEVLGEDGDGTSAGDDPEQVVPSSLDSTAVTIDELAQVN